MLQKYRKSEPQIFGLENFWNISQKGAYSHILFQSQYVFNRKKKLYSFCKKRGSHILLARKIRKCTSHLDFFMIKKKKVIPPLYQLT